MKTKNFLTTIILLASMSFLAVSCDKESIVSEDKLPTEVTQYINTHFPNVAILQSIIERDNLKKSYEVILEGNIELKFNSKKEIVDIEGTSKLPDSVVPEKIRQYVAEKYPNNFIIGWELDDRNQQVELDNGLDLEFKMNGDFIRIDN
mgnify:CR=1 FL=1